MYQCKCYHQYGNFAECWGTKERELCTCNGNTNNCNFYNKKEKRKMNIANMWLKAQEDGKTYLVVNGDVAYNKNLGFFSIINNKKWPANAFNYVNDIFESVWKEYNECLMTKEEAEKKFGIKIIG